MWWPWCLNDFDRFPQGQMEPIRQEKDLNQGVEIWHSENKNILFRCLLKKRSENILVSRLHFLAIWPQKSRFSIFHLRRGLEFWDQKVPQLFVEPLADKFLFVRVCWGWESIAYKVWALFITGLKSYPILKADFLTHIGPISQKCTESTVFPLLAKNRPENLPSKRYNFLTPLWKVPRLCERCSPNPRTPWQKGTWVVRALQKVAALFDPKIRDPS